MRKHQQKKPERKKSRFGSNTSKVYKTRKRKMISAVRVEQRILKVSLLKQLIEEYMAKMSIIDDNEDVIRMSIPGLSDFEEVMLTISIRNNNVPATTIAPDEELPEELIILGGNKKA